MEQANFFSFQDFCFSPMAEIPYSTNERNNELQIVCLMLLGGRCLTLDNANTALDALFFTGLTW